MTYQLKDIVKQNGITYVVMGKTNNTNNEYFLLANILDYEDLVILKYDLLRNNSTILYQSDSKYDLVINELIDSMNKFIDEQEG